MKRKKTLKSSPQLNSSTKVAAQYSYLPDDCWNHVFKFLNDDENNRCYLESLSLVSKQFLSITNRLKFSLKICDPTLPFLPRLFQRFTNLTSLDLTRFYGDHDSLLSEISNLPFHILNLESLKILNIYKFPSNGLRDFSKKIKTLTSLTIPNIDTLSYNDIILISDCFPLLEEFNITYKHFSFKNIDGCVNSMSMVFPKLGKINIFGYHNYVEMILNLCKNCEFLEEVNMLKCPLLTHNDIVYAIRERPTLKSLCVRWSNNNIISSHFIDSLVSLKGLTCLHLWCSRISDELLSSIAKEGLPLRRLLLQYCHGYSYAGISCLLSKCQSIQHLNLESAKFMNDHHVAELSLFLGDLVSINLSKCGMLTDSALFALTRKCPSLSEIKMEHTCIGKEMVEDSDSVMSLVVSPQLKSLHLAHNSCLRYEHIVMFASIFPNLQFLDLSYCKDISKGIGEVFRCCKIRHLNLACCSKLKILRMNFEVSTLEVLNLSGSKIYDKSLRVISKSCFGLLQLDLGRCKYVTEKGVREVVDKCTKLREINLDQCLKVNANVVDWMVLIRPSLRKIMAPPSFCFSEKKRRPLLHHGCLVC